MAIEDVVIYVGGVYGVAPFVARQELADALIDTAEIVVGRERAAIVNWSCEFVDGETTQLRFTAKNGNETMYVERLIVDL